MKLSRGRLPPTDDGSGGWHYPASPGVILRAATEELLIKLLAEYRQRNNIELGDIERDIDDYYCRRWPTACHPEPSDVNPNAPRTPARESMINRVQRWASMATRIMPRGGHAMATQPEAMARGQTCLGCPRNVAWKAGCRGCGNSTARLVTELKRAKKTQLDAQLLACDVGGWANDAAIWLPKEATPIGEDQKRFMPKLCWRKAL